MLKLNTLNLGTGKLDTGPTQRHRTLKLDTVVTKSTTMPNTMPPASRRFFGPR